MVRAREKEDKTNQARESENETKKPNRGEQESRTTEQRIRTTKQRKPDRGGEAVEHPLTFGSYVNIQIGN